MCMYKYGFFELYRSLNKRKTNRYYINKKLIKNLALKTPSNIHRLRARVKSFVFLGGGVEESGSGQFQGAYPSKYPPMYVAIRYLDVIYNLVLNRKIPQVVHKVP